MGRFRACHVGDGVCYCRGCTAEVLFLEEGVPGVSTGGGWDRARMAERRHLANAPITEALVDFRASAGQPLGPEGLSYLKDKLGERYPKSKEQRRVGFELRIESGTPKPRSSLEAFHGHLFESADGHDLAQFRVDGFTYNRLKPYTDGDAILAEALRLWALYVEVAAPPLVNRLALRYINHLRLATDLEGLGTYLTAAPTPPRGATGRMRSFLTRLLTHDSGTQLSVITTQAVEEAIMPGPITLLLDIDAYRLADLGTGPEQLRPTLDALRNLKNDVFFGSISEETVRLCG